MRILFIHPNFPGQFRHLAEALGRYPDNQVLFLTENPRTDWEIRGVKKIIYPPPLPVANLSPPLRSFSISEQKGEAVLHILEKLKKKGFNPDIIYGHSGWGNTWYIKDVFPHAKFMGYFEWYYNARSADMMFDRKNPAPPLTAATLRLKNAVILNDLLEADICISPTKWQRAQFPKGLQHRIQVLHEGINTDYFKPDPAAVVTIEGKNYTSRDSLITYCSRGMEPYRGFPQFMKALPFILKEAPNSHIIIAGSDRTCYGTPPADGKSYKEKMLETLPLDLSRIHFTGPLPYKDYLKVLQISSVHVYLTRPFVLSWSMLEAMSCGCTLVASDTEPVKEVITEGVNGFLTDFHSPDKIAERVLSILSYPSFMKEIKQKARQTIVEKYNLKNTLVEYTEMINKLTKTAN